MFFQICEETIEEVVENEQIKMRSQTSKSVNCFKNYYKSTIGIVDFYYYL